MTEILARDGEGAEHLLRCTVRGALNDAEARLVAKSLVNSPLIKTMVHGADPNVGRILMAVGKCFDATIRTAETNAWVNGHEVVRDGARVDFDEAVVRTALATEVVDLEVSLGAGTASATAYGCDLTKGYVEENAAYYSELGSRLDPLSVRTIQFLLHRKKPRVLTERIEHRIHARIHEPATSLVDRLLDPVQRDVQIAEPRLIVPKATGET